MLIDSEKLQQFVSAIFVSGGAEFSVAQETAKHLVLANLKGHDSHGVGMVPTYIQNLRAGTLNPTAHAKTIRDSGSVILIDGQFGFGQIVGKEATDIAVTRVKENGLACIGLRNAHHLGRIGTYGEIAGAAGFVSMHFVNVVGHEPRVSPYAGTEARLQTNPFCCVVPRDRNEPIVLDMATSAIALGKVRVAYNAKKEVPDGALVDHEGNPTNDPRVIYEKPSGTLGPFGKHKGYGLAFMCELLGGGLVGEWTMQPDNQRVGTIVNHMLMVVLDPDLFGGHARFQSEVSSMIDYVQSTQVAAGHDKVRIPGEPELESMEDRLSNKIPIDNTSWNEILDAAKLIGMQPKDIDRLTI
ncbi:MAG: malate/lactate/ureidoglycolate dehydrogenase [Gammaproteobacteria bacterium]|nr:malate/lactate/ureidoglycolate dehydrogenase [Gammaproteobacteria bacterium]MCH2350002.1 malate/lactate/ureidoglycolate dehydrogenase [Pseudomonadales bacterium]HAO55502.1 malate/lactate/ureidoglycolate dehydrogenase [Gammaproteobacteria bacterium]|tara:strand:+ start:1535 stop:2599 length:1065 start_codon:yes stop_codon:yes gene_type:complete